MAYTVLAGLFVYRQFDWKRVQPMLVETASLSGAILLIIGCATAMAWALTQSGFSNSLVALMWRANAEAGRASLLLAYSFGKAQRLLCGVDAGIGPIVVHDAVEAVNGAYREHGVLLPPTLRLADVTDKALLRRALVIAPPGAQTGAFAKALGDCSDAFASGWMQLRGARRRQSLDRGFVLSDHADWPGLQAAIAATGAERVIVTHGYEAVMVRWLQQQGLQAGSFRTEYGGDDAGLTRLKPERPAAALPQCRLTQQFPGHGLTSVFSASSGLRKVYRTV